MFWLLRCAMAIGVLYWLSPLRSPEAVAGPPWRRLETGWHDTTAVVRKLPLESLGRDAAAGALSALRRPTGASEGAAPRP